MLSHFGKKNGEVQMFERSFGSIHACIFSRGCVWCPFLSEGAVIVFFRK